ncbi:MAG: DNA repair protein RadC [Alphaproteobacteria bacterium]|nr:DNA repair protein RadC [Alphaproteobacteria bacterium]
METYQNRTPLKNWAEDDRPREKLLLKGRHSLSDAELLAILIGSGTRYDSAVDLAKQVFRKAHDNLGELSKLGISELTGIRGIGKARAITILAALELGRRRDESMVPEKEKITKSFQAYQIFRSVIGDKPWEEFWILLLNRSNRILKKCNISEGGISGTTVDPKKIFKIALDHHATSIILGHNHPSGALHPSEPDKKLTKKIREAGIFLEIDVLDHLIIAENGYYSFADQGEMS